MTKTKDRIEQELLPSLKKKIDQEKDQEKRWKLTIKYQQLKRLRDEL
jgi:hypothetical protein